MALPLELVVTSVALVIESPTSVSKMVALITGPPTPIGLWRL